MGGECCVCCTSAAGGLSSLRSPSLRHQGRWHRTGRTFARAVWQCQDCFLPLSFITEAPFSLCEPLCVSIFRRHKTACLMMIAALQFSPSPTMFYLAGWPWQSLSQKPAASSSSKQFHTFSWRSYRLCSLAAHAQEGAGHSLAGPPQGEGRGEDGACPCSSKEPLIAAATDPLPSTTPHHILTSAKPLCGQEASTWPCASLLLLNGSNPLARSTCWGPAAFLRGPLVPQGLPVQSQAWGDARLHAACSSSSLAVVPFLLRLSGSGSSNEEVCPH